MSTMLDKAQQQFDTGQYSAAVATLGSVEATVLRYHDAYEAQALLDLAVKLRDCTSGRTSKLCDRMAHSAQNVLADPRFGAMVVVPGCQLIGGSGFDIERPSEGTWDVIFRDDQVLVHQVERGVNDYTYRLQGQTLSLEWRGLSINISGAGAIRKGGGFIGGGFGIVGAAAGMLTASALNAMASGSSVDTVLHLQTPSGELFLHYDRQTPEVLRRTLSPVFTRLRQEQPRDPSPSDASADHVVDRLHKLADLLDRGLLTPEEFAQLKADLLSGNI